MPFLVVLFAVLWTNAAHAEVKIASWHVPGLHHEDGVAISPAFQTRSAEDFDRLQTFAENLQVDIIALQGFSSQNAAHRLFPKSDYWVHGAPKLDPDTGELRGVPGKTYAGFVIRKSSKFEIVAVEQLDAFAVEHIELGASDNRNERLTPSAASITMDYEGETVTLLSVHFQGGCPEARLFVFEKNERRRAKGSNRYACRTLFAQALILENWLERQHALGRSVIVLGEFNRYLNETQGRGMTPDDLWLALYDEEPEGLALRKGPAGFKFPCYEDTKVSETIPTGFVLFDASLDGWIDTETIRPVLYPQDWAPTGLAQCPVVLDFSRRPL